MTTPTSEQSSREQEPRWKCGNEFAAYHPSASHVDPSYRDGWNACYKAALDEYDRRLKNPLSGQTAESGEAARWRPEVVAFADAMEEKLRANDWKGGWKDDASGALMTRVREEFREFEQAHLAYPRDTDAYRANLRAEGADVANMVMMVLDVCGALSTPSALPAQAAGEWISVKDRLPTHNYSVLGVVVDGPFVVDDGSDDRMRDVVSYEPSRGWLQHDGSDSVVVTVTHWQDLPELP